MSRFLVNLVVFASCLTLAVLTAFKLSCWWAFLVLVLSLFLVDKARLLR